MTRNGPLTGVRIVEFAGIGPGPFAGMLLSDLGADILRIDRKDAPPPSTLDVPSRGRKSLALDLKTAKDVETAKQALAAADILIEGFRPGVMERLGLGPEVECASNPRLIYGRMTGWGQQGPLAQAAGHDINYIALTGALSSIGSPGAPPPPPLNLVGDYGGGALYLTVGILAALFERERSGKGQVIDAAIVDGAASLMAPFTYMRAVGTGVCRGENFLDGSAHFYRCYRCRDSRYVSVGAIEPRFYRLLLDAVGGEAISQAPKDWTGGTEMLASIFALKTRDDWVDLLEGTDACFAPVLELGEAPAHPHLAARGTFTEAFGVLQPGPAPRLSRTPATIQGPPPALDAGGQDLLGEWLSDPSRRDEPA